jgi:hypothetical protein
MVLSRFLTRTIVCFVLGTVTALAWPSPAYAASHWICRDGIYSESSCWDEGIPTDPGEIGVIDENGLGVPYFVTIDVDPTFGTLNVTAPEARVIIGSGREVNPAVSFNVVPGGPEVYMTDSSFIGGTGVYTNGGLLSVKRTCLMDLAGFEQNNLLRIAATGIAGGNAELTVNTSFTNHGTMELQGACCDGRNATLIVPGSDVLTNTGGINLLAGPGNRFIDANLDNQGTINLGVTSFFNKVDGQYSSSAAINFGESVVLNIDNGSTFTQTAGLIDMPSSSYIDVDTGGAYFFDGGTLNGQARLTNADLSLAPASIGGAFEFRGPDGTLTGDIGADQSVTLFATGTGLNAAVTTTGDLTNNGTLSTTAGCCNGTSTTIIVPDGYLFTNIGLLNLSAEFGPQNITADLDNQGTVNVGRTTAFNKTNGLYSNNGSITVSGAGGINLSDGADFSQDGGTLDLQGTTEMTVSAGSTFTFNGGDITGTGVVGLTNADLVIGPGSTGTGQFRFRGANSTLTGDIAPNQSLLLQATGTGGIAVVTTTGSVTNAGEIRTDAGCCAGPNTTLAVPVGFVLTNTGSIYLEGSVGSRFITADFFNQGFLLVDRPSFFNNPTGAYVNQGTISIQPGDSLTATGSFLINTGSGTITGSGTLNVAGVSFSQEGVLSPGDSVGTLTVTGTYNQILSGELQIEIGGTAPGTEHDRLQVNGTANLGGTLDITLIDDYELEPGQEYVILTANAINGTFDNVVAPGNVQVTYTANQVSVTPCPFGDINGDCVLDLADFQLLSDCLTGPQPPLPPGCDAADLDFDGDVDLGDFAAFQRAMTP